MAMPRKGKRLSHLQPSPSKFKLLEREGGFILDCVAVDRIAQDYSRSSPKLGFVIPPYDARQDPHLAAYFATKPVCALFRKKGQANRRPSSYEKLVQRFQSRGEAVLYLLNRNKAGAGHSAAQVRGHQLFLNSNKPVLGYNGACGYRRNTPSLRKQPSVFGRATNLSLF